MKTIGIRKLRSNSRWWQFTEPERTEIRGIFEHDGEMAAVEYCRQIGKPWSHTSISRFFAKERAAKRAEDLEIRKDRARLKELITIYAQAGMDLTEAMAIQLAAKLREALKLSEADPKTAEGRAIIMKAARHVIALRALDLREREETDRCEFRIKEAELAVKKMELQERQVLVQERKLAEALRQNADKVPEIMPGSGNTDEKTDAPGRLIFSSSELSELSVLNSRITGPYECIPIGPPLSSPVSPLQPSAAFCNLVQPIVKRKKETEERRRPGPICAEDSARYTSAGDEQRQREDAPVRNDAEIAA